MAPFLKNYDGFDPETLAILTISLDATCEELQHNPCLDQTSARTAIADLNMKIASRGQSDPQKIKALAFPPLPKPFVICVKFHHFRQMKGS